MKLYKSLIQFFIYNVTYGQGLALVWEDKAFKDGYPVDSGTVVNVDGVLTAITWSVYNDGIGTIVEHESLDDFLVFSSNLRGGDSGNLIMGFDNDSFDPNDFVQLNFNFDESISNLSLQWLDIDQLGWSDAVEVRYNGINNIVANPALYTIINSSYISLDNEIYMNVFELILYGGSSNDQPYGNLEVNFGNTSITL